jgi:hypothetical protein
MPDERRYIYTPGPFIKADDAFLKREFENIARGLNGGHAALADGIAEINRELIARPRQNLLINATFEQANRGTVFTGLTYGYTLDRWYWHGSGGTANIQRTAFGVGSSFNGNYGIWVACTTSDNWAALLQRIANPNCIIGKTVTFSGLINTNKDGLKSFVSLYREVPGPTDPTGISGPLADVPNTGGLWRAHSWQMQVPNRDPSWTGSDRIVAQFSLFSTGADASTAAWNAGVFQPQLELGDYATDFEFVSPAINAVECARYFQIFSASALTQYTGRSGNGQATAWPVSFGIPMRVSPTITRKAVSIGTNWTDHQLIGLDNRNAVLISLNNGGLLFCYSGGGTWWLDAEIY